MGYTLWNLLRDAYQELGQLQVGTATDGSATTLVDTQLIHRGKDGDWTHGTLIILKDGGGAGAAPEGECSRVSSYADSSGTLTIDSLSAAVAAGDVYGLAAGDYPLQQMIELANLALQGLGDVVLVDMTTLETAAHQTEYAAAAAWNRRPPRQVDLQTRTGDADDHGWTPVYDWEFVPAAAGSSGLIVFKSQPAAGRDLRVWYQDVHPRVNAYSDLIHETIHPGLASAALVEKALTWKISQLEGEDMFTAQRLLDARNHLERMEMLHPFWKPGPRARMLIAGIGKNQ